MAGSSRSLGLQSKLGAMLDSAADVVTLISAMIGIAVFHPEVLREHAVGCGAVLGGWIVVSLLAFLRYGRRRELSYRCARRASAMTRLLSRGVVPVGIRRSAFLPCARDEPSSASVEELGLLWFPPQCDVRVAVRVLREAGPAGDQRSVNGSPTQPD